MTDLETIKVAIRDAECEQVDLGINPPGVTWLMGNARIWLEELVEQIEFLRSERRRLSNSLLLADEAIRQCTCEFGAKELREMDARD